MADKNIKITVRDRRAIVEGSPVIICGNSGYTVTFAFDDEWNLTGARTARFVYFKDGTVQHEDVVFSGNVAAVPVLSDVAFVKVGVFAGDLQTTTPARINCELSILCGSGAVYEPTPDVYDQIMALFNEMAEKGAFGATEAQAQQIAANQADIQALVSGGKKAGDAEKLGGHDSSYFATAQSVANNKADIDKLKNGTTPAGDANKLGGKSASEYVQNVITSGYNNTDDPNTTELSRIRTRHANCPTADVEYIIDTTFVDSTANTYERRQTAYGTGGNNVVYNRAKTYNGTWSTWEKVGGNADSVGGASLSDIQGWVGANYLPLSGGTITGNLTAHKANGSVDIMAKNDVHNISLSTNPAGYAGIYDGTANKWLLARNNNGALMIDGNNAPLHTGNSAKVAFTESDATAPSDTTALWAHL